LALEDAFDRVTTVPPPAEHGTLRTDAAGRLAEAAALLDI
jgi:hypothetical protein